MKKKVNFTKISEKSHNKKFIEYLLSKFFEQSFDYDGYSPLEKCIEKNDCLENKFIDSVLLNKNESIFSRANYKYKMVGEEYLSPVINLCGVRMGSDKLTHMLIDGFRMYQMNEFDILKLSLLEETQFMGVELTSVLSYGDVFANYAGFRMFRDLFYLNKNLTIKNEENSNLDFHFDVNVCEYITPLFDERISTTIYFGDNKEKVVAEIKDKEKCKETISVEDQQKIKSRTQGHNFVDEINNFASPRIVLLGKFLENPFNTAEFITNFNHSKVVDIEQRKDVINLFQGFDESVSHNKYYNLETHGYIYKSKS